MVIARLENLRLDLGSTPVLTGIDLTVHEGERVGIAGPNGAGKTTLLSVLATLRPPTEGEGEVLGEPLGTARVSRVRPRIAWSRHEPGLWDELTLAENLEHVARLAGLDPAAAASVLVQVGLGAAAHRRAVACSNGMRRRADLARLLMTRPTLALLDEAQAGLDAEAALIVDAIAHRTVDGGGGVVMVSHDADLLAARVDRVLTLVDGKLAA